MSVHLDGNIIFLEGRMPCRGCGAIARPASGRPGATVDLTDAEHLHAAVLQVLMALRPTIQGTGGDAFLRDWIAPALIGATSVEPGPQGTEELSFSRHPLKEAYNLSPTGRSGRSGRPIPSGVFEWR